jgi:raffinose/stachyose/melibiose transport system permease protein
MHAGRNRSHPLVYPITFAVPALVLYCVFFILPTVSGFYFAFTNWNSSSSKIAFVGLSQFVEVLKNSDLTGAFKNTFAYAITTTILKNLIGLALALFLSRRIPSRNALRAVYFAPAVLNIVAIGLVFRALLDPNYGLLNNILRRAGLGVFALGWIFDPKLAIYCGSLVEIWRATGIAMAIYIAGLATIPKEYYEACRIDGANAWQRFHRITLPLLMPAITINVLLSVVYGIRMFEVIYFLTEGGPGDASAVIMTKAYEYMGMGLYAYSSAFTMLLVLLTILVSIPLLVYLRKKETEA